MPLLPVLSLISCLNLIEALLLSAAEKISKKCAKCHKCADVLNNCCYILYSIKLYNGITTSISLALSIGILFVSHMQSINGAKIFKYYFFIVITWVIYFLLCFFNKYICITINK